ncbi:MAG: hypothetical protein Q7U84_00755 [Polynucleobacter sp.]|jgi:hypothetical protein|nr:hypothetical protein [Polynucleobacter sp.]OZB49378.1 MAG: hypothetical protein B7X60_01320 [Polynucleobacter sp. 39-45-136]
MTFTSTFSAPNISVGLQLNSSTNLCLGARLIAPAVVLGTLLGSSGGHVAPFVNLASQTAIPLSKSVHASLGQNWIDAHSYAWLESRGIVVSSEMQIFRSMLFENFKSTNISSQLYLDAEESWRKVLVTVKLPESTDFDVAYGYEMSFFQKVSKSAFLSRIMDNLILKVV